MASRKQRRAARKNIRKAIKAAKRKQTLKHLPKKPAELSESKQRKSGTHKDELLLITLHLAQRCTALLESFKLNQEVIR